MYAVIELAVVLSGVLERPLDSSLGTGGNVERDPSAHLPHVFVEPSQGALQCILRVYGLA